MGIDDLRPRKHHLQGEIVEHPHALALDADPRTGSEPRQRRARCREGLRIAALVAPVEDRARKTDRREGLHFEIGNNRHRLAGPGHDDLQRPFHLVEIGGEDPPEIGARHQHQGVEPAARQDGMDGSEQGRVIIHGVSLRRRCGLSLA